MERRQAAARGRAVPKPLLPLPGDASGCVGADTGIPAPPTPAVSMKQNDIWIAATAHVSQATLLSTDRDFEHLHGIWVDYSYVDQSKVP